MKSNMALWGRVRRIVNALDATQLAQTSGTIVEDTSTGTPKVVDCASSGTANTFGSWVQVDASTAAASYVCGITIQTADATAKTCTVEVGTGAEAAEATKIRISFGSGAAAIQPIFYTLPVPMLVAASTRIAIRASDSEAGANTYSIGIQYYNSL